MVNNRRRVLKILALSGATVCLPDLLMADDKSYRWTGYALGADSSIELYAKSQQEADRVIENAVEIIKYYEKLFNIHDVNSELSKLNRYGYLKNPTAEFLDLIDKSISFYVKTKGAFDVTIQPLWELYNTYFRNEYDVDLSERLQSVLPLIGSNNIIVEHDYISFNNNRMAISFNGIAQGYITDKVTEYLKSEGYSNILVDLGEYSAGGPQANGEPWRIGILNPFDTVSVADVIEMNSGAIATSGGYGNLFDINGKHHHLFNPKTGLSSQKYASVSVKAKDATTADALSTAFSNMDVSDIENSISKHDIEYVHLIYHDGQVTRMSS